MPPKHKLADSKDAPPSKRTRSAAQANLPDLPQLLPSQFLAPSSSHAGHWCPLPTSSIPSLNQPSNNVSLPDQPPSAISSPFTYVTDSVTPTSSYPTHFVEVQQCMFYFKSSKVVDHVYCLHFLIPLQAQIKKASLMKITL